MAKEIVFVAGKNPLEELGGGHSSYVRAHARAAIRAGFLPRLFCVGRTEGRIETDYGVIHQTRSSRNLGPYSTVEGVRSSSIPWHEPMIASAIERFLRDRKEPQLIHGFGLWGSVGVTASRKLQQRGVEAIPIVNAYTSLEHEHRGKRLGVNREHGGGLRLSVKAEYLWVKHVIGRYERRAYFGSRAVLFNYESVRRILLDRFGPGMRFRKTPYSSEMAFTQKDGAERPESPRSIAALESRKAPLVVSVSRHDPRKGVEVLLLALARLKERGVEFRACLVGGGQLLEQNRRLAERLNLDGVVAIEGFAPDVSVYLRHADVFALPSLEEGSGSVSLIEAMQAGLPVVASKIDGIPEDVTDGDSALLVEPGNVAALSQAVERAITDQALRQKLARRAREVFVEKFSPEVLSDALRDIYGELGFTP
ncbi:MAG: glycosyltransferase family 4 protein [Blastocatellales bacterium]